MTIFSLILEASGYIIKIILIFTFWCIVFSMTFNWFKISNDSPFVRFIRIFAQPPLLYIRKKFPFMVQRGIDFTPILLIFVILLLHLLVVDTLLEAAYRLR